MGLAPLVALRLAVDLRGADFDQPVLGCDVMVNPGEVLQQVTVRDNGVKDYFVKNY
jgi:hypothetical protein